MNSIEIRNQRAELIRNSQEWLTKATADAMPEAELDQEWGKRNAEIDRLEAEANKAERAERMEHLTTDLSRSTGRKSSPVAPGRTNTAPTANERNKMLKSWLGYGLPGIQTDGDTMERAARFGLPLHAATVNCRSISDSADANILFATYSPDVQKELKYFSPIYSRCTVRQTGDGNSFSIPQATDVANAVGIIGETSASAINVDPSFTKVTLGAYMFRTVVQVTYEMLEDAVFPIEQYVNETLGLRFARTMEKYLTVGTGSSQPQGVMQAAITADGGTPAVTLAATKKNLYQFQDLYTLFSSVDLAYRPNCTLVLHDSSVWDLRKITDSNGRFIWDVNNQLAQNAVPDKIAGYNYLVSNSIDASGSFSKNLAVFADLSRHNIRLVDGVRLTRLNELYRVNGMIGIECVMRWDSKYIGHAASIARLATPAS